MGATEEPHRKRALTLAGGGPAAGLHIGALMELEDEIDFDIFALSCIGAWVGIVYQTRPGPKKAEQTAEFFRRNVFRDDATYRWFPVNRAFAPNYHEIARAQFEFVTRHAFDHTLFDWPAIARGWQNTLAFMLDPSRWTSQSALNSWLLNDVFAVHPMSRWFTAMMYLSRVNGLANIYYDDSAFLKALRIEELAKPEAVEIYHNAWNIPAKQIQLFHNRPGDHEDRDYKPITTRSLCACSALPYVEQTVEIDGIEYCEGALVDTVNFKDVLRDHPDLDEVWISRIVDASQVQSPKNLHDGLANLCMLFAAEVGENDIKLFRHHLRNAKSDVPEVVEVPIVPDTTVTFEWSEGNLDRGIAEGRRAARAAIDQYRKTHPRPQAAA